MSAELKMSESTLYEIWQKQIFHDSFKTIIGEKIDVVDSGVMNGETAGPDFKNARIRIGNLTYIGDIEIDLDYSDWKTHGHNIDNKYNKVVLHASLFNRNNHGYVYTRSGRKVPSICLSEYLDKDVLTEFKHQLANEKSNTSQKFKCIDANDVVTAEKKEKFLSQLGIERFQKKCKRMYNRLKELQFLKELNVKEPIIAYELSAQFHERKFKNSEYNSKEIWQQLLYEMIFEALGYSKNKAPMTSLAHIANVNFLQRIEKDGVLVEKYEAALFYISGLAHSVESASEKNTKEYIERIYLHWNALKPFYDSKYMEETQWHFFKLRPQNFPRYC